MITERAFFFRTGERPLYGVLFEPAPGGAPRTGRGLVICDSLYEEKAWCERVFANLGRHLARLGHTVLLFDYHGYGNSSGESEDVTVTGIVSDIEAACDLLRGREAGALALLSVRWGCAPACMAAAGRPDVDTVILVNPVAVWKKQFMQALRANVAGQYAIFKKAVRTREQIIDDCLTEGVCVEAGYRMNNIDGFIFSKEFYEEAIATSVPLGMPEHVRSVTVMTIPERSGAVEVRPDPLADEIRVPGGSCEGIVIEGDNAFWINNRIFTSFAPGFFEAVESRMLPVPTAAAALPAARPVETSESIEIAGVRETAVETVTDAGHPLKAVLYEPASQARDYGFVFTHGGLIGMNGAFRFNTRAARDLALAGFPCICCDTHGIGRSGGTLENQEQRVLFREICAGLFAPDVLAAVRVLRERTGVRRVAPFGVCGGAITNILAHARYPEIDESVLLSVPVMLPGLEYGKVRMTEGYARFYLGMYLRKIFSPKAWWRLVTMQSENRMIFSSLRLSIAGALRRLTGRSAPKQSAAPAAKPPEAAGRPKGGLETTVPGIGDDLQFNPGFLEAFRAIAARGQRIFFVFGENDNFRWEFESEFLEGCRDDVERAGDLIRIDRIQHANHMYTLREWQEEIISRCIEWARQAP